MKLLCALVSFAFIFSQAFEHNPVQIVRNIRAQPGQRGNFLYRYGFDSFNGLTAFGREDLALAIKEWELVAAVNPSYKKVDPNLKKAKTLFERLEKIKQNSQTTQ